MAGRCPLCNGEHNGEVERFGFQAEGHIRIPLGDGTDAVWFVCDQHKVRWRENYHRESWTPGLSNDDERAPHERDWTLGRLCEHRTHLLSRYREVEPYDEAKRHLVEIPDRFAVARWSRDADVAEIARCILGTLKYEPHAADVTVLRCALESVIEAETGARR
jgi:hypothetical protein